MVFALPKSPRAGIIQDVTISDGLMHLVICIYISSMYLHGLIAHLFLVLHNIPLFGQTVVHLSIQLLKGILIAPSFGNDEQSCPEHPCAGFCVLSDQLLQVNSKEHRNAVWYWLCVFFWRTLIALLSGFGVVDVITFRSLRWHVVKIRINTPISWGCYEN